MRNRFGAACVALVTLTLAGGCERVQDVGIAPSNRVPTSPEIHATEPVVLRNVQFSDIPVPDEYKIRRRESSTFQGNTLRFGRLVYDGIGTSFHTSQWYMSNMPQAGWALVDSQYRGQYRALHIFSKGRERARVDVFDVANGVRVVIDIWNEGDPVPREMVYRR